MVVMAVPGCGLSVEERTGQEPGWSLPLAPDRSRSFEAVLMNSCSVIPYLFLCYICNKTEKVTQKYEKNHEII